MTKIIKVENYEFSNEEHLKDYPGYEIIFNEPTKILILWKEREDIENGKPDGIKHPAIIEEDEVIEIHLWKEVFYPFDWKIAFEQEECGRIIDYKNIYGWRFLGLQEVKA